MLNHSQPTASTATQAPLTVTAAPPLPPEMLNGAPQSHTQQQHATQDTHATGPMVLVVLDGWGVAPPSRANAIAMAATPVMDRLTHEYPTVTLHASGEEVGLPYNEMGNSEVGHLNIGAGKILYQQLPKIDKGIADGSFFQNPTFLGAMQAVKERGSKLHIMGLCSYGGIHSSQTHLLSLLELCRQQGLGDDVFIHAFLDGRDTERNAALESMAKLETKMGELGVGHIATIQGRFWAMDRDNRWDRIEAAYNTIRYGKADHQWDSPLQAIEESYKEHVYDEEFRPTVIINDDGSPVTTVENGDVMIFFNFRSDRARELTKAFVLPGFSKFDRGEPLKDLIFVTMTEYERNLPVRVAYEQEDVEYPLARVFAEAGKKQLHIAETEKYAHVTFFLNGGAEEPFEGEERILVSSPRVTSYEEKPEMSASEITQKAVEAINTGAHDFIVMNFANADMIGHTGNFQATVKAVEVIDTCIGKIAEAVFAKNGTLIITADHGNAEVMIDTATGEMSKEHTRNAVPCILANAELKEQRAMWPPVNDGDISRLQPVGVLADIAPTIITLSGLQVPQQMTGRSLVRMS